MKYKPIINTRKLQKGGPVQKNLVSKHQIGGTMYISFPNYSISTPVGKAPLGHAMVIAVNDKGITRGSEYGRYDKKEKGQARRVIVPNFTAKDMQNPTDEELQTYLQQLYKVYNKAHPQIGDRVTMKYIKNRPYTDVVKTMETAERKGIGKDYSLKGITCGSYAHNIATGDDVDDIEFGAPGFNIPFLNTTPWSGRSASYINKNYKQR